jgi:hypothetical protein
MVFARMLEHVFPYIGILQFGARNDFRQALRKQNSVSVVHGKRYRTQGGILPQREEFANALAAYAHRTGRELVAF